MTNEMSAEQAAEIFETLLCIGQESYSENHLKAMETAASILRKVAVGELKPVVHAEWKEVEPGSDILFKCSNCGRIISTSWGCCEDEDTKGDIGCDPIDEWLTCPTCGAKMDGGEKHE